MLKISILTTNVIGKYSLKMGGIISFTLLLLVLLVSLFINEKLLIILLLILSF